MRDFLIVIRSNYAENRFAYLKNGGCVRHFSSTQVKVAELKKRIIMNSNRNYMDGKGVCVYNISFEIS